MKIETGKRPPPAPQTEIKYPFQDMKVGDSFFVPLKGRTKKAVQSSILATAHRRGYEVTTRRLTEAGVDGLRVWLVGGNVKELME